MEKLLSHENFSYNPFGMIKVGKKALNTGINSYVGWNLYSTCLKFEWTSRELLSRQLGSIFFCIRVRNHIFCSNFQKRILLWNSVKCTLNWWFMDLYLFSHLRLIFIGLFTSFSARIYVHRFCALWIDILWSYLC